MDVDVATLSHEELLAAYHQRERVIVEQQRQIADHQQQIADHQQTILQKQYLIAKLERMLFGSSRERFTVPDGQQILPFLVDTERVTEAVEKEAATIAVEYTRTAKATHPGRLPLPEHLEVVEITHEPDVDTTGMTRIGQEVTNELVHEPARLYVRRHIRPKYVTPEHEDASQSVVIASLPERAIDKCIASDELLAEITINKHVYHLPIYRQLQMFAALGVPLPASTVDNWQRLLGLRLRPLYAALRAMIPQASYLQVDETGIAVQDRAKKGTTHRGYMWAYHAPVDGIIYFDYQRGRGALHCRDMLGEYRGYLQTDGYAAYTQHKAREAIRPLACWAHVRRKFFDAQTNDQVRATEALALIGALYDIERDARERGLSAAQRKALRLERSHPVTTAIGQWLVRALEETTPKSPIGAAVRYAHALWDELENYLHDGNLEIDNNLIENAIRPLALGRKNYLFAGSHDAAVNIAMYRSFFATCRLHDIDAKQWLLHVLRSIATTPTDQYHTLLPQNIDRSLLA
jgi:transposase